MRADVLLSLLAGLTVTASVPPFGWWPLGPVGLALLATVLRDRPARRRGVCGAAFGAALYGVSLFWAKEFTVPGWIAFALVECVLTALVLAAAPPGRGWTVGFPAVVVAAEALRGAWPFGGLPLAGIDLGQAGGPVAPVAALGGRLLVIGVVALAGIALAGVAERVRAPAGAGGWRRLAAPAAPAALALAVVGAGWAVPAGTVDGKLRVAAVQGGGPRGLRASDERARATFAAHLAASETIRGPVDLIVWPEDVIDVDRFAGSPEADLVADVARRHRATVVVGIVEEATPTRFLNAVVALAPDGTVVDRYDKVRRVPYGEFFPGRRLIERLAAIPEREAVPGRGPGILRTPAGDAAVLISYEVFFGDRGRAGVRAGGRFVLVPTNAASFTTSQMPTQQVAAARLRAIETGLDLVQAGPTGFTAFVEPDGAVVRRSVLGARQVLHGTVALRHGRTPFVRTGPAPVVVLTAVALAGAWWWDRKAWGTEPK